MSGRIEIEIFPCDEATESTCPLCGETLLLSSRTGLLYDGDQPLGCMCSRCLEETPHQVAARLRKRVVDLYKFVRKARHYLDGEPWGGCIEKVRRRAEHWDALSGRLACLQEWPIREGAAV
jgi:hypothetical protein